VRQLCTDDVTVWGPASFTASADELAAAIERRDEGFSAVELEVTPLDVTGDRACAEWSASMTHSGPVTLAGGPSLEPTGVRITMHGVTVAEFQGDRICAARQYYDELSVLDQLGVLRPPEPDATA
jgi:SnoaL-like domain